MARYTKKVTKTAQYERFLDEFVLNPDIVKLNITKCAKLLTVDRVTIYNWLELKETVDYLDGHGDKIRKRIERRKALHNACLEGNPQAIKLEEQVIEGFRERSEIEHSGEIDANIVISAIKKHKKVKE